MNYGIHEAGVFHDLDKNLKKWVELLKKGQSNTLSQNQGEFYIAGVMRHMPPKFFDRLDKYLEGLSVEFKQSITPTLMIARDHTAFYSHSRFWEYRSGDLSKDLSFPERKVQYAIDHDIYSFSLSVEKQKLVKEGRAGLTVTRKNYKKSTARNTSCNYSRN